MAKKEEKKVETKEKDDAKTKKSPLMLIIIVLSALLVIGGGAAAYFIFFKAPADEEIEVSHGKGENKKKDEHSKKKGDKSHEAEPININLDPFLVNLAEPKAKHFLKVSITLQIKNEETKVEVEKKLANIKNDILLLLSSKTIEDIITMEGKIRLKEEMMIRITKIVGEDKVTDIFFSQFVVQ